MPRIAEDEKRAERIALEKRIKSFAVRNLPYREAFKAVGRDTLAVVLSVALLLGLKRLYAVLFKGEDFKTAWRGYLKEDLKDAEEEGLKTFIVGSLYILLRRGFFRVFRNVSLLKVILFVEITSVVVKNFLALRRRYIDRGTFWRIPLSQILVAVISIYGTATGATIGSHLGRKYNFHPVVLSVVFVFPLGSFGSRLGRRFLYLWGIKV